MERCGPQVLVLYLSEKDVVLEVVHLQSKLDRINGKSWAEVSCDVCFR